MRPKKEVSYVTFSEVWSALGQDLTYLISDPEVIRRKQLKREQMSGGGFPVVQEGRSKSSADADGGESRDAADSFNQWIAHELPQQQSPPEKPNMKQRRRAMVESASTQSLLGHHTPAHTEAKRPPVRRSAGSGSDAAYYLAADNGVYYESSMQHDASSAQSYRSEHVRGLVQQQQAPASSASSPHALSPLRRGHMPPTQEAATHPGIFSFLFAS